LPTGTEAPFLVPAFDGPAPQHVKNGTTHVLKNPNRAASAFRTVEYTLPPGWETGDVYIGKKLGQPGEVAIRPASSPEDVEELYAVLGSIVMDRY